MTTIAFDNGVTGGTLTAIGDDPIYHHRTHTVYGVPSVADLSGTYPVSNAVRVHPASVWNGQDIVPMVNTSDLQIDIWFGDPSDGGTRVAYSLNNSGSQDLMAGAPVSGWRFPPKRLLVVGDRMVAYCSAHEIATGRDGKIAILSAAMSDLEAGNASPWTLHFVTNEYSTAAVNAGSAWAMSEPHLFAGSYWCVVTDYVSVTKEGGQCWILEISSTGTPQGMVRLHTRSGQTGEHWHGGCLLFGGSEYTAIWHTGDTAKRLQYRTIADITAYADNATVDTSSGISGSFRVSNASASDWSALAIAAGPDEGTSLTNSEWKNAFILCVDPNDATRFLYGGDVSGGLIERVSLDANGVAVCETVFNPRSRETQQIGSSSTQQLSTFLASCNGSRMAAIVSNELDDGDNVTQYSGVIASDDDGDTWGWVWKGSTTSGAGQNDGIAQLSGGKVIIGALGSSDSVRVITPGAKVQGLPAFFGFRPANLVGTAAEQDILNDGGGTVTSQGSSPEKALPAFLHGEEVFSIVSSEGAGAPNIEFVDLGIDETAIRAANMMATFWVRRRTPAAASEQNRMGVETRLGWNSPNATGDYGAAAVRYTPPPKCAPDDWTRMIGMYDGSNITGAFNNDPNDLRANVRAIGTSNSAGRAELFMESICLDLDRPPLPYPTRAASGIASGKFTGLSLGTSWTVLAVLQIPEECWDSWTGDESGAWASGAPVLAVSDGTNGVQLQAKMDAVASGGAGVAHTDADFNWGVYDSANATVDEIPDHPLRTTAVLIAISKDGTGDIQYAIGGPGGVATGTRAMAVSVDADIVIFADIGETDALEMYVHRVLADSTARTAAELATILGTLELTAADLSATHSGSPLASGGEIDLGDEILEGTATSVTITLTNDGDATANIGTVGLTGPLSISGTAPTTIEPAASADLVLTVDTSTEGAISGTVSIPSDDPDSPYTLTITGTVINNDADIDISQVGASGGTIALGDVALDAVADQAITITNTAAEPGDDLTLGTLALTGDGTLTVDPSDAVIEPGQSAAATVRMDTSAAGAISAQLTIPSDDPDEAEFIVNITATVVGPQLGVTDSDGETVEDDGTVALGTLTQNAETAVALTVTNTGLTDLTLGTVMAAGRASISGDGDPSGQTIAPAGTAELIVSIDTGTLGALTGSISVPSDAPGSPFALGFTATVEQAVVDGSGDGLGGMYMTVAEATAIIGEYLMSVNAHRKAWAALNTDDRRRCIKLAGIDFDSIAWDGRIIEPDQLTAWPRENRCGELIQPGGEAEIPPSLDQEAWAFTGLPIEIRIGIALQAAFIAARELGGDQTGEILGQAAAGITGVNGSGVSYSVDGARARMASSRLHPEVRKLVYRYMPRTVETA